MFECVIRVDVLYNVKPQTNVQGNGLSWVKSSAEIYLFYVSIIKLFEMANDVLCQPYT